MSCSSLQIEAGCFDLTDQGCVQSCANIADDGCVEAGMDGAVRMCPTMPLARPNVMEGWPAYRIAGFKLWVLLAVVAIVCIVCLCLIRSRG